MFREAAFAPKEEARLSELFPMSHLEGDTLVCKDGSRSRIYRLQGVDFASQLLTMTESLSQKRLHFFNCLSKQGGHAKVITMKRRAANKQERVLLQNQVAQKLSDRWADYTRNDYTVEHYLILSVPPSQARKQFRRFDELEELLPLLDEYRPRRLENKEPFSEILSFCLALTSRHSQNVKPVWQDLDDYLGSSPITLNLKTGLIHYEDVPSYEKVLSLSRWGETSKSEILEALFRRSREILVVHTIQGLPKEKAKYHLRKPRSFVKTDRQKEEEQAALELIENDESAAQIYQLDVFVRGASVEDLEDHVRSLRNLLSDFGLVSKVETSGIHYAFLNQFPGVRELALRPTTAMSHNLSHFIVLSKKPKGLTRCSFGEGATQFFKTLGGETYPFCFHKDDAANALGHTLVVAPTGAGKTTLIAHLVLGLLKYPSMKCLLLDRFQGLRIFTEILGGSYQTLGNDALELNPLLIDKTPQDKRRLIDFLKVLARGQGEEAELSEFVDHICSLPPEKRRLQDVFEEGLRSKEGGGPSDLKKALESWAIGNQKEWFNGVKKGKAFDALSFEQQITGLDMTDILKDDALALPMTSYLMSCLQGYVQKNACPHFIFIDEAYGIAKNPFFRSHVLETSIFEQRKLNGSVALCFQGVNQIDSLSLVETLSDNTASKFLFPIPKGTRKVEEIYRDGFNVTDLEWEYLTQSRRVIAGGFQRTVLLKKEEESVILDIDLSPLGPFLKAYSSSRADVNRFQSLPREGSWQQDFLRA